MRNPLNSRRQPPRANTSLPSLWSSRAGSPTRSPLGKCPLKSTPSTFGAHGPGMALRDGARSEAARPAGGPRPCARAVELQPRTPKHWSNLGVALWRTGESQAAVEALEKADQMSKNRDHSHRFFLAMAYWQTGAKDKGRQTYDQGVQWMDKNQPKNEELRRFRAEAEGRMGILSKP